MRRKEKDKKIKNTTARSRTWTGSLAGGGGWSFSPFISQSLRLFIYNPQWRAGGRVQMGDGSIDVIEAWRVSWGMTGVAEGGLRGTTSRILVPCLAVKGTNLMSSRIGWAGRCGVDRC